MALHSPEFRHITDDALREWKSSGSGGFKLPGPVPTHRFLYELCWALVRGDLPLQKCKTALDSAEFSDGKSSEEVGSFLADIIAHMVQDPTMPGDYHTRLVKLAKLLVDSAVVPQRLLQERCEEDFLWESEMTKLKAQDLKAKEVRVNTRLLYQQTKFNLLREESEGYAKLVTLLCQSGLESTTESTPAAIISVIKSLIGHFDLDPNRVFDIVLECFELHPQCNNFYNLIPIFPKSHASQVLGFKFQYYQRIEVKIPVPFGLYRLAALLVKAESIDLDSIYMHLLPKDDEAFEVYNSFLAKRLDEVNKIGKINLAATGKDLLEEDKQDAVTDLLVALDMENEAVAERAPELESNQCLGLLLGFLSVDDWCHAHILFERLSHLNPTEHIQICDGLLRLIEKSISHFYALIFPNAPQNRISKDPNIDSAEGSALPLSQSSSIDLPRKIFQMLSFAGPYLHRDTILLQKVCRVLKGYYLSAQELLRAPDCADTANARFHFKEARTLVEEALGTCLLPSLQLIPANPAIGQEIWEVLCLLPYEVRFRLYGEWEKEEEQLPIVLSARQIAKLETRRFLKRLAKENLKQKGRMVAKLAHANPMTVLRTIVHQIEAYRDMIPPVVEAFKYLTQLEYDILEYVVIERLAQGGREKLKDDGLNLSDWLQSLASFWGHLCKRYPSMELRGLFQYLINQLKKGIGSDLILLEEVIQQMANVLYTENMTEEQLDAMAGSETLRSQAYTFGMTRSKALLKSTNRLRDSLLPKEEPKLAIPLLLLIAQYRSTVVMNADAPYIKMVSEQFDRCHGTLLQYVDFLCSSLTPIAAYAQLIPTLHDLVHKYHLDAEVAFLIYRPVMRLFKCPSKPGICWPLDSSGESLIQNSEKDMDRSEIRLDHLPNQKPLTWSNLLDTVRSMLPSKSWNSLSPELYATFWGLTLYDLYVPRSRYDSEITKQHAAIKALEELSDNSSSAIDKRKKEKERIQELLDRLTSDIHIHEEHVASVRRRLSSEKDKWLTSCSDTLKTNMEFFQRCIFPRCIFSMPDAIYCAMFVHTLHSLETPFFNTVNHLDIFICKTLQPMICCCTEYEAGRLGRFLCESLKMAYHWKSDESIYDRECGNKPGFAVYYRFPNSPRVTFAQFVRVHIKWGARLTKLFIQSLESTEYMEIRNALITLTKISSVFPVTRRSGVNIEKRVVKIKTDDREDLKVLATGVAASLAARKSSWVSDEEFSMGYVDPKPAGSAAKSLSGNMINVQNGSSMNNQNEGAGVRVDRAENASISKSDLPSQKVKSSSAPNHPEAVSPTIGAFGISKPSTSQKNMDDNVKGPLEESMVRVPKSAGDFETKSKRSSQALSKQPKQEIIKDDSKFSKSISRGVNQTSTLNGDKETWSYLAEGKQGGALMSSMPANGLSMSTLGKVSVTSIRDAADMHGNTQNIEAGSNKTPDLRLSVEKDIDSTEVADGLKSTSRAISSPVHDESIISSRIADKQQKRTSSTEEQERIIKRRKGDEPRDAHSLENERTGEQARNKTLDKSKDRISERHDKDHKEKNDRSDKARSEEIFDKARDKSVEKFGRERSIERPQDRGPDRGSDRLIDKPRDDRNKEERNKSRHNDTSLHLDERFHGQNLPPPPPLPSYFVPQSVSSGRRDEDADRRAGTTRHMQRLSPRNDEKERRHSEENLIVSLDEAKHRREDDSRERKHEERDGASVKVEDREREKANLVKDDIDPAAATKRRKIKREMPSSEAGRDYSPASPPIHSALPSQPTDGRDRGERKAALVQHRAPYNEESLSRMHTKEGATKIPRRDNDQVHEREWEEEKRLRAEAKRKHRK